MGSVQKEGREVGEGVAARAERGASTEGGGRGEGGGSVGVHRGKVVEVVLVGSCCAA